jgi:hypothetical protein
VQLRLSDPGALDRRGSLMARASDRIERIALRSTSKALRLLEALDQCLDAAHRIQKFRSNEKTEISAAKVPFGPPDGSVKTTRGVRLLVFSFLDRRQTLAILWPIAPRLSGSQASVLSSESWKQNGGVSDNHRPGQERGGYRPPVPQ